VGKIDQALEYVSRTIYHHRASSTPYLREKKEKKEKKREIKKSWGATKTYTRRNKPKNFLQGVHISRLKKGEVNRSCNN